MFQLTHLAGRLPRIAAALAFSLTIAAPAHANGSVPLPDPGGLTLLSLGLAGLIIGRRAASRRKDED